MPPSRKRKSGEEPNEQPPQKRPLPPSALSGRYWAEPGRPTVVQEALALPVELRSEIAKYLSGEDLLNLMTMAPAPENGRAHLVPQARTRHAAPIASLHPRAVRTPMFMPSPLELLVKKLEHRGITKFILDGDIQGIQKLLKHKKLDPAALHKPGVMLKGVVSGHLGMVKYLHEVHGVSFQGIDMFHAYTNINMIKYLYSQGVVFTDDYKEFIFQTPELDILEFMYSKGVVFPADAIDSSIYLYDREKVLPLFRFFHETVGLPCTPALMKKIIMRDYLDVLQYLHTKGQQFPQELLCYAITHTNVRMTEFLHQIVARKRCHS